MSLSRSTLELSRRALELMLESAQEDVRWQEQMLADAQARVDELRGSMAEVDESLRASRRHVGSNGSLGATPSHVGRIAAGDHRNADDGDKDGADAPVLGPAPENDRIRAHTLPDLSSESTSDDLGAGGADGEAAAAQDSGAQDGGDPDEAAIDGAAPNWLLVERVLSRAPVEGLTRDEVFARMLDAGCVDPAKRRAERKAVGKTIRRGLERARRFEEDEHGRVRLSAAGRRELDEEERRANGAGVVRPAAPAAV